MAEETNQVPIIDQLRRKRGHRRGAITKLHRKVNLLLEKNLADVGPLEVQKFIDDLRREVKLHDSL